MNVCVCFPIKTKNISSQVKKKERTDTIVNLISDRRSQKAWSNDTCALFDDRMRTMNDLPRKQKGEANHIMPRHKIIQINMDERM